MIIADNLEITPLVVGSLETNCYVLHDTKTHELAVIDPGGDTERILQTIQQLGYPLKWIINTHGHIDHIGGNATLKEATGASIVIHVKDAEMLGDPRLNGAEWLGLPFMPSVPDILIDEQETYTIGSLEFQLLHTPGHSPGGMSLYGNNILLSGDVLFRGSVGRWDLPGGDRNQLMASLEGITRLPGNTRVYPGHGPDTTIKNERYCIHLI